MLEYVDITKQNVYLDENKVLVALSNLQSEQRRLALLLADTVKEPMEIWNKWEKNEKTQNSWRQYRCYYQWVDTSQTSIIEPLVILGVNFIFEESEKKWVFDDFSVHAGEAPYLNEKIAPLLRSGVRVYP